MYTFNPSTWRLWVWGQSGLHSKFQASHDTWLCSGEDPVLKQNKTELNKNIYLLAITNLKFSQGLNSQG